MEVFIVDESSTFFLYVIVDIIALLSMGLANITRPVGLDKKYIVSDDSKISGPMSSLSTS